MIDVFSKVARYFTLKKQIDDVVRAFDDDQPLMLQTDKGVQGLLKRYGIHDFATHEETKASIDERFNHTRKTRMWRYLTKHETWRYIEILQDVRITTRPSGASVSHRLR